MPNKQEKQKRVVNTAPSRSLWERIFGNTPMTPEMEEGIRIAQSEIPNLGPVEPYGPLSRLMNPNANAYTSPSQSIYLNPSRLQGRSAQDIADTITHEQTHVNQMKARGTNPVSEFLRTATTFGNDPYHRRPDEMEAFRAEFERRQRMNRNQTPIPSFLTGNMYTPRDIKLNTGPTRRR